MCRLHVRNVGVVVGQAHQHFGGLPEILAYFRQIFKHYFTLLYVLALVQTATLWMSVCQLDMP